MPVAITQPKLRLDPLPNFGFAILMMRVVRGWFTECSGLAMEREVLDYTEGGTNHFVHQLPGRVKQNRIILKHGLAGNDLWRWFQTGLYDGKVERHNISIVLFTPALMVHTWWDIKDAFPVKWSGPTLNAGSNELTVETLELAHHGISMRDFSAADLAAGLV